VAASPTRRDTTSPIALYVTTTFSEVEAVVSLALFDVSLLDEQADIANTRQVVEAKKENLDKAGMSLS
jgi:hypothetical protein